MISILYNGYIKYIFDKGGYMRRSLLMGVLGILLLSVAPTHVMANHSPDYNCIVEIDSYNIVIKTKVVNGITYVRRWNFVDNCWVDDAWRKK